MFLPLISATDLAAVYFNIRMLLSCFKDRTKRPSLQKLRPFVICQCFYQVTILATNTLKVWGALGVDHGEPFCVLRMLETAMKMLLYCNLIAISVVIVPEDKDRQFRPMLLVFAALCLVFIGSTAIWRHSCWLREVLPQKAMILILAFLLLLLLLLYAKITQLDLIDTELQTSSPCDILRENKTFILATFWLILCCGLILLKVLDLPWVPLKELGEQNVFYLNAFMLNSVVGIALPLVLTDWLNSSKEEETEMKTILV